MKLSQKQLEGLLSNAELSANGKNIYSDCPKCDHHEFGISLAENHTFNCFRKKNCGWTGNIFTLLSFLKRTDLAPQVNLRDKLVSNLEGEVTEEKKELPTHKPIAWRRVYEDKYLDKRGFTKQDYEANEVGKSIVNKNYITFLVRMEGKITGTVGRYIGKGDVKKKYDNSPHDFGKMLYGYDSIEKDRTKSVILVEGIFDQVAVTRNLCLHEDPELKACCTFGGKFSEAQQDLLKRKGVENIWFLFEADIIVKIKPVIAKAAHHFNVRASFIPKDRDPGDMNVEETIKVLEESVDYLTFNLNFV